MPSFAKEIIETFKYPFFEARTERYVEWANTEVQAAYDYNGLYLGDPEFIKKLCSKYGVDHFEKRTPTSGIASIGFSSKTNTWYGWSHRAISGFRVGMNAGEWHPNSKSDGYITTVAQAKAAAKKFAESVS